MSVLSVFFFFKQKTAYEMRISDWSSDVCSSDLLVTAVLGARGIRHVHVVAHGDGVHVVGELLARAQEEGAQADVPQVLSAMLLSAPLFFESAHSLSKRLLFGSLAPLYWQLTGPRGFGRTFRSEEHTSELQSLMRISYAVFCLKKKTNTYDA